MTPAQRSARHRAKLQAERRRKPLLEKQERRRQREAELAAATVKASLALGTELYGVIYADPPMLDGAVIEASATRHSAKPDAFARMIEDYFPTTPKVEMFARRRRDGWDTWGNEVVLTEGS